MQDLELELPVDLFGLANSIKSIMEESVDWIKCDSKLSLNRSSFKDGSGKEKSHIQLSYSIESAHPSIPEESHLIVNIKVNKDRSIEMVFGGLKLQPYFSVNAYAYLSESQISDIPMLIGKYLDIKTSGYPQNA